MNSWRSVRKVLVCDAETIGAIGVIRSLGRAGYTVIATSSDPAACGLNSRFAALSVIHPPYASEAFDPWLDTAIGDHCIDLIIPSEAFLNRIRSRFEILQPLLPLPPSADVTYAAFSKSDVRRRFIEAGLTSNLPPALLISESDPLPTIGELRELSLPLFLKVDAVHSCSSRGGAVVRCATATKAQGKIAELREDYKVVLVEGFVTGVGVGAFLASWRGQLLTEFMHRRLHEVPHTGGYSSYRCSWRHQTVLADAKARAKLLEWDGIGMFEYRWDPDTDRFWLMEINARFWGSLHLALFAGVDFPALLADAFFGKPAPPVQNYADVRCRLTFPAEVDYVVSCLKDGSLSWLRRLLPIAEFVGLQLSPTVYADLSFPGDRALYWRMMARTLRRYGALALEKARR